MSREEADYGSDQFSGESGASSPAASRSRSTSPLAHTRTDNRPRGSRPSDTSAAQRRQDPYAEDRPIRDDAAYYDGAEADHVAARENTDLRSASAALGATTLAKLRPTDVAQLKGLSGDAWQRKLGELVATVKGESYSRAPAHASLLIDSTGFSALGGRSVNHIDPSTDGASSGSYFSSNPPEFHSNARQSTAAAVEENRRLFEIARVSDGAIYAAKAYQRPRGGAKVEQKDKVLDKFAMDAEEMRHTLKTLKKQAQALKGELTTVHREADLLDAHLQAQTAALDDAAMKKGFLRVGSVDKPRYEKVVSSATSGSGAASAVSGKLSLEEQLLTLSVQQKSLRAQKAKLEQAYEDLQDEVGSFQPGYRSAQEAEQDQRQRVLSELHQLQAQLQVEKRKHQEEEKRQEMRIHELRHEAGQVQAMLDVQRKSLTASTLAYQEQLDQKTAMQAKIKAIQKRLARHGQ